MGRRELAFVLIWLITRQFDDIDPVYARAPHQTTTGDWPFIRGPNFDGRSSETGLIERFPSQGPPVLWARPLGVGYSGFVSAGDRVFTQYQTLGGQYIACLNSKTGEAIWEFRYELPYDPAGMYPGPRATPTLANEYVSFASPSGLVGCLNASDGELRWSLNLFERFQVEPVEFGYSCSPVVVGDTVLVPVGAPKASMVALDASTGRVRWQAGDDAISHVPAMPIIWRGRQLVIGYLRNVIAAFDLHDGKILWRMARSSSYDEHAAWPIYREPYLWISGPFRAGSELIELTADPPGYRTVWISKIMSNDVCSSVLVEDNLYGFDIRDQQTKPHRPSRGRFRCIDFLTGKERWANGTDSRVERVDDHEAEATDYRVTPQPSGLPVGHTGVIYADGKLILLNDLGDLIMAEASPNEYRELGRARVLGGELCWTPPSLSHGLVFARNHSRAVCLSLKKSTNNVVPGSPTLTVADLPQTTYRDWASLLLAVEPEFAMDLPSNGQLWRWYSISIGGLLAAAVIATLVQLSLAPFEVGLTREQAAWISAAIAFVFGALGTTLLSLWSQRFIFTWPLCLFVAFEITFHRARQKHVPTTTLNRWLDRLLLLGFLTLCVGYFLLCRRLSLAFEWVFLGGFIAAAPLLLLARKRMQNERHQFVRKATLSALAFSTFYLASIAILWCRYGQ